MGKRQVNFLSLVHFGAVPGLQEFDIGRKTACYKQTSWHSQVQLRPYRQAWFQMRLLILFATSYVLLCALVFLAQRKMIYLPNLISLNSMSSPASRLALWPTRDENYLGLLSLDSPASAHGTILVFHGNAGSAVDRDYYASALQPHGYRVIVSEYPGYGARSGRRSEKAFVDDAKQLVSRVRQTFGDPIFLWGESLGAGVVAAVADEVDAAGVVMMTPWDSLPEVAQSVYWFLPARWLVLDRYDNVANLRKYSGPVAVILAEHDEIIPAKHGRHLFESLAGQQRLWVLKDAGHNNWPAAPHHAWWGEVLNFLNTNRALK